MTIAELIDELRRFPPTAPVAIAERTLADGATMETTFSRADNVEAGSGPDGYDVIIRGES